VKCGDSEICRDMTVMGGGGVVAFVEIRSLLKYIMRTFIAITYEKLCEQNG
jgi:hypothetical protein